MSLQVLAQDMAARGRGPDTQLIHMSPREVAGLQALAMAHGGSLSINPDTGLPEAGILDNLLPMILGVGAMALTGGAAGAAMPGLFGLGMPATIGLGVGALQTARTGDLGKGLMAGLGAYGGAGLAGGLMAAGGAGAAGAGAAEAANTAAMESMGSALARDQAAAAALPSGLGTGSFGVSPVAPMPEFFSQYPAINAGTQVNALGAPSIPLSPPVAPPTTPPPSAFGQNLSQMGRGLTNLTEAGGREAFMSEAGVGGGMGLLKYGAAAGLPMLLDEGEDSAPAPVDREQMRFAYNPGRVENPMAGYPADYRGEYAYFRPTFTRMAMGGPVEDMSAANVYDMQNARGGVSDMGVDMSTGMQRMADGGLSGFKPLSGYGDETRNGYTYDPLTQSYKKVEPQKLTKATGMGSDRMLESGGMGGDMAGGKSSSNDFGMGAIGFGQGLAGLGLTGLGNAIAGPGINALGAAEAAAAQGVSDHAADSAANAAGIGAAFGNADSTSDSGVGVGASDAGPGEADGGLLRKRVGGLAAMAGGGYSHLGDYSDGGRLLRGPGDGVSDSIPATIANKRPARLADGEFVIPARIVSELGNGSTEAGARKLYAMMDRVQRARGKTTGKGKVAKDTRSDKYLPA
jgi:hypothetical protein